MCTATAPKLYIFDADGTLRWTTRAGAKYPVDGSEWLLMPHVAQRLRQIPWSAGGPWLGIASNQCGVGEGLLCRNLAIELITDMVLAAIGYVPAGTRIEICTCPEGSFCPRQKPQPGLLLAHLTALGVAAHEALYVGDLDIDRRAAEAAGLPFEWAPSFFAPSALGAGGLD
jgi:histidinol phosphatase-like enzyme